jgi:GntR family transcriptional regulator
VADPMYKQIAEDLRRQIEAGELAPGQQLRTEIELRDKYNASRNTVRDAIKWLITRGLVETRPGQGTFVVEKIVPFITTLTGNPKTGFAEGNPYEPPTTSGSRTTGGEGDPDYNEEVAATRRSPSGTEPRVEIQKAAAPLTDELRIEEGALIISRHQLRSIDDTPWSLQTSFYPMKLAELGASRLLHAANMPEGTVSYLSATLGINQVGWRDMITVRAPDVTEAAFFELPDDGRVAVIATRRTAFDEHGNPIRVTVTVYPADRNEFAVNVGQVPAEFADPPSAKDYPPAAARSIGRPEGG